MKKLFQIISFIVTIQFSLAQVSTTFRTTNVDFTIVSSGIYKVVSNSQNQTSTTQVGAPQLPVTSQTFALPQGSVVTSLAIANGSKIEMGGLIYLSILHNHLV